MISPRRGRWELRLLWHHLPLMVLCGGAVWALDVTRPYEDPVSRLSFATAYPALVLMAATLLTGPWNVLRGKRNPVSSDLRRDLGIWAGVLAVVHAAVGQNVHLRGRPWLYYIYEPASRHFFPLRHDLFGFSNYTGALSALVVLLLVATSNDVALRRLGTPRWKRLQRWNYGAFALAAMHTVAYQWNEQHVAGFKILAVLAVALTASLQVGGLVSRRALRHASS